MLHLDCDSLSILKSSLMHLSQRSRGNWLLRERLEQLTKRTPKLVLNEPLDILEAVLRCCIEAHSQLSSISLREPIIGLRYFLPILDVDALLSHNVVLELLG